MRTDHFRPHTVTSVLELQLDLPGTSGRRVALEEALRSAVRSGRLAADSTMPSSRSLAIDLGVSRSTVVAAYEQLIAEGYLTARRGSATTVADVHTPRAHDLEPGELGPPIPAPEHDFRPGEPDRSTFPRANWQRSLRRVLTDAPDDAFGYPDPRGVEQLRAELSMYLARTRTVHSSAPAVQIFGGFGSALGFIGEALLRRGIERVATEDPMLPYHAHILRLVGIDTTPVGVDAEGIDVEHLRSTRARAVLVTPAHQYPTGVTMSADRRAELIAWSRAVDGWVIEDDYDGEFRYDRRPIGALQGLAPERVVYVGTASKSLGPALRLSWLVVPEALRRDLQRVTHVRAGVSAIDQLALADFIGRGDLDRQVRQARSRYRTRRDGLVEVLTSEAPWLEVTGTAAGLHLMSTIADAHIDEAAVLHAAAEHSVGLTGIRTHHRTDAAPPGFAIGFSRPAQHRFAHALERLACALQAVPRRR